MSGMDPKLKAHLNRTLARFAAEIQAREKSPIRRMAKLWECAKRAHDAAKSGAERRFWRQYLDEIAVAASKRKTEALMRKWSVS